MKEVAEYILDKQLGVEQSSMWLAWEDKHGSIDKVCFIGDKDGKTRKLIEIDAKSCHNRFYTGPKKTFYNFEMKKITLSFSLLLDISSFKLEKKNKKANELTIFSGKILNADEYKYIFDHISIVVYSENRNLPVALEKVVLF